MSDLIQRLRTRPTGDPYLHMLVHEAADAIERLTAERDAARADAERHRWLRDLKCCTFTLSRDDGHAANYMSASEWIAEHPEWFQDTPAEEIERMRSANTIWSLQVYPNTPVGSIEWHGATIDAAVDAAIRAMSEGQ